jgi:hypothetical protein
MFTYFNDDGSLRVIPAAVFDEDGYIYEEVIYQITNDFKNYSSDSDAIKLFYAEQYANQTNGHYSPMDLFLGDPENE